jgi:hypothetical protein
MMSLRNRIGSVVVAGVIGMSAVAATVPSAHAATVVCTNPGSATNFVNADGSLNLAAYLAAVANFNACVSGTGVLASTQGGALAFTGSDSTRLAILGVALVGVGAGALGFSRRRRRADATANSDLSS